MVYPVHLKSAAIYANEQFICMDTWSGYGDLLRDPKGKSIILPSSADNVSTGNALLEVISVSRQMSLDEANALADLDVLKQNYDAWVQTLLAGSTYKNRTAMFRNMKSCSVTIKDGSFIVKPSYHDRLEAWSGDGITESDYVIIPANSSPDDIGAAIRLALSRCL